MKGKHYVKGITFNLKKKRDTDILDHINNQANASAYIKQLVADDMASDGKSLQEKIWEALEEYTNLNKEFHEKVEKGEVQSPHILPKNNHNIDVPMTIVNGCMNLKE